MTQSIPRHLYHLTPVANLAAVLSEGLRAGPDGAIYAFTDLIVANTIACHQVFVRGEYAILKIAPRGISGDVMPDEVAEYSAPFHRRIVQAWIEPRHLRHIGNGVTVTDRPLAWDFIVGERIFGESAEQTRERWQTLAKLLAHNDGAVVA